MKVVHISNSTSGGAGAAAFRLHAALLEQGVESVFITKHDNMPEQHVSAYKRPVVSKILERLFPPIGRISFSNFIRSASNYEVLSFPYALYNIANNEDVRSADIINLHWVGNMLNYKAFFGNISAPVLWTLHDLNPVLGFTHYMGDDSAIRTSINLSRVDSKAKLYKCVSYERCKNIYIACLSKYIYNISKKSKAFKDREHFFVQNCIDTNTFKPKDKCLLRKKWKIPYDKKVILFVSQHIKNQRKGFAFLIKAIENVKNNCLFLSVGQPAGLTKNNLVELGFISDETALSEIYSCADALLLPSIEDNLPNTMLESLACGTPVISFPVGGMVNTIKNEYNGITASDVSVGGLSNAINRFLTDGVKWNASQISKNAADMFSPCRVASDYIKIYNKITNVK